MAGRVFVTGGSGFVGSVVIDELVRRGYGVNALMHRRRPTRIEPGVTMFEGDLFDRDALDAGMKGCDAVIHLVGIIMERRSKGITFERMHYEGTKSVVDAAARNNIRRYVHMSALGTRPDAVSNYHQTKYRAEQYVRQSHLAWTIFRPSMIHGPKGELMRMEAAWARGKAPPFLFMPYFGAGAFGRGGAGRLQPVFVEDVARAFVDALEKPQTVGEVYLLAGPERVTWPELHQTVAQAVVGRKRWVNAMPVGVAKTLAAIGVGRLLGFNRDQVIMSQEDNTADITKFVEDFGWEPKPFRETVQQYAGQM